MRPLPPNLPTGHLLLPRTERSHRFAPVCQVFGDAPLPLAPNSHRLPITRHEKIVVTMVAPAASEIRPEEEGGKDGVVRKDEDGVLSWTLKLQPGEKRTIPLKFYVEYPADFAVSGME